MVTVPGEAVPAAAAATARRLVRRGARCRDGCGPECLSPVTRTVVDSGRDMAGPGRAQAWSDSLLQWACPAGHVVSVMCLFLLCVFLYVYHWQAFRFLLD